MELMEIGAKWGFLALIIAALAWYVVYVEKQHREDIKQLREEHKTEVKELTRAFDRLNGTVQKLIDVIRGT